MVVADSFDSSLQTGSLFHYFLEQPLRRLNFGNVMVQCRLKLPHTGYEILAPSLMSGR